MEKINPFIENIKSQLPEGNTLSPLINNNKIQNHYFKGSDGYLYTDKYGDIRKVYPEKNNNKYILMSIASDLSKGIYTDAEIARRNNATVFLVMQVKNDKFIDIIGKVNYKPKYNKGLSDDDIYNIYTRAHNGESLNKLAKEFDISPKTARNIYYPTSGNGKYERILKERGCNIFKKENISDEKFIEIFNKANSGEKSMAELAIEYGISERTISKIKNCSENYAEYAKRNNITPPQKIEITDDIVVKVYELAIEGMSDDSIGRELGIASSTVKLIRTGSRHYGQILERNGLHPVIKNIVINTKANKFSESEAIAIYEELKKTGMSGTKMSYIKGCDKGLINDIKYCRNSYEYLQSKYGLKPLI